MISAQYMVEFNNSLGHERTKSFGGNRKAALAFARKRSSQPSNDYAYVLVLRPQDDGSLKAIGHISYSAGYRADKDGNWNP